MPHSLGVQEKRAKMLKTIRENYESKLQKTSEDGVKFSEVFALGTGPMNGALVGKGTA